jgi:hypothetical protein
MVMLVERLSRYTPIGDFNGGCVRHSEHASIIEHQSPCVDPNDRAADVPTSEFQVT